LAFRFLSENEGIIPALESAHAVAWVMKNADRFDRDDIVVINLSGRGDKDVAEIAGLPGVQS
jgi:tryptophan synthase beta chain